MEVLLRALQTLDLLEWNTGLGTTFGATDALQQTVIASHWTGNTKHGSIPKTEFTPFH